MHCLPLISSIRGLLIYTKIDWEQENHYSTQPVPSSFTNLYETSDIQVPPQQNQACPLRTNHQI